MHPFRQGLLEGRSIVLAGAMPDGIRDLLETLGARTRELSPELATDEDGVSTWLQEQGPFDALVCGEDSEQPPTHDDLLVRAWVAVRAVATEAFIPRREGRIVLLAPREDGGITAAALENLARTLSVEWARFGVTVVAVALGAATRDEQLAQLVAFICSVAGGYFSGCRIELGLVRPKARA